MMEKQVHSFISVWNIISVFYKWSMMFCMKIYFDKKFKFKMIQGDFTFTFKLLTILPVNMILCLEHLFVNVFIYIRRSLKATLHFGVWIARFARNFDFPIKLYGERFSVTRFHIPSCIQNLSFQNPCSKIGNVT